MIAKRKKQPAPKPTSTVYICVVGAHAYTGKTMEVAYAELLATGCDVDPPPPNLCVWFRGVRVDAEITERPPHDNP